MKSLTASIMTTTVTLALGAVIAQAQNWTGSVPLGDVARQLKAQRAKSTKRTRVFTNDDLVALRISGNQLVSSAATSAATKVVEHSGPSTEHGRAAQLSHRVTSPRAHESAKIKSPAATQVGTGAGAPPQMAAASTSAPPPLRQDLGYVQTADGRVSAIVAEGERVSLVQETQAFVQNFHVSAPSPTEVEVAQAPPPPIDSTASPVPQADAAYTVSSAEDANNSPAAIAEADTALSRQPAPTPGNNGEPPSEASATLQSEPLADYAGDQNRVKAPETIQAPPCSAFPASVPEGAVGHSDVTTIGYVEKADGEREAIVAVRDQVYLVHEGEVFAEKYKAVRVTPTSIEIGEELTEASSASPEVKRYPNADRSPDSN